MHRWLKGQVVWWTVCKSRLRYFRVNNPNPQKGHKKKPGMFLEFNYFDNELVKCSSYNAIQNIQKKNLNLKNMETIGNIRCPGRLPNGWPHKPWICWKQQLQTETKLDMCLWNTDAPGGNKVQLWQKSLSPTFWPRPTPRGRVMSVKCEQPLDELTVQVW